MNSYAFQFDASPYEVALLELLTHQQVKLVQFEVRNLLIIEALEPNMDCLALLEDSPTYFLHLLHLHFGQVVDLVLQQLVFEGEIAVSLGVYVEDVDLARCGTRLAAEQTRDFGLITAESSLIGHVEQDDVGRPDELDNFQGRVVFGLVDVLGMGKRRGQFHSIIEWIWQGEVDVHDFDLGSLLGHHPLIEALVSLPCYNVVDGLPGVFLHIVRVMPQSEISDLLVFLLLIECEAGNARDGRYVLAVQVFFAIERAIELSKLFVYLLDVHRLLFQAQFGLYFLLLLGLQLEFGLDFLRFYLRQTQFACTPYPLVLLIENTHSLEIIPDSLLILAFPELITGDAEDGDVAQLRSGQNTPGRLEGTDRYAIIQGQRLLEVFIQSLQHALELGQEVLRLTLDQFQKARGEMDHAYLLEIASHLQFSHNFAHGGKYFDGELGGIARNKQFSIMFGIEHLGLGGIQVVGMVETHHFLLQVLVEPFPLHIVRTLVGVGEEEVGGLGAEIVEVESSDVLHVVVVVIHQVHDVDEPEGDPPVDVSQVPSRQVATEMDAFVDLLD